MFAVLIALFALSRISACSESFWLTLLYRDRGKGYGGEGEGEFDEEVCSVFTQNA